MKAALAYARLGWAVIPLHHVLADGACSCGSPKCTSQGKHPRFSSWPTDATTDAEQIDAWWAKNPEANVGIATGAKSGVFAVDLDGERGADWWARFEAQHGPVHTTTAITGSGGRHLIFRMPAHGIRNSAKSIAPGVDVRGDGGQIVGAPSRSAKGPYRWAPGLDPWKTPPAEAPVQLLALLNTAPKARPAEDTRGYYPPASAEVLDAVREEIGRAHV